MPMKIRDPWQVLEGKSPPELTLVLTSVRPSQLFVPRTARRGINHKDFGLQNLVRNLLANLYVRALIRLTCSDRVPWTILRPPSAPAAERGLVLAVVLVFLVVLTLTGFLASALTRTDIQVVSSLRSEKRAFYVAEAGITEALIRLSMSNPTNVTVDGNTFNAVIQPNESQPSWTGSILFGATSVTSTSTLLTTPTIQPAVSRLPYSKVFAGDPETLTLSWNLCTAVGTGCTSVGAIRTINGKKVLQIAAIGQDGAARRRVNLLVAGFSGVGFLVLADVHEAVDCSGSCNLNISPGTLQVNSTKSDAVNVSGSGAITGTVNVTGGCAGTCNVSPSLNTGAAQVADPLQFLQSQEPARPGSLPVQSDAGLILNPGYYPNGINVSSVAKLMNPGLYVLGPGKKFNVSGGGSVVQTAPGITIFADQFVISGASALTLTAPANSPQVYNGVLLWQSAASTQKMVFSGGSSGTIDGAIYVPNALLEVSGGSGTMKLEFVVGTLTISGPSFIGQASSPVRGYSTIAWADF